MVTDDELRHHVYAVTAATGRPPRSGEVSTTLSASKAEVLAGFTRLRSEEHVNRWCATRKVPRRPLITLDQLWQLAVAWYSNRLTPEARRPVGDEIREIFDGLGLTDPFWRA